MRFGQLIDGKIQYAPYPLRLWQTFTDSESGEEISGYFDSYSPTKAQYAEAGYYPIYDTEPEEPAGDGKHYEKRGWAEGVDKEGDPAILRVWEIVDDPAPEVTLEDALYKLAGGI